MYDRCGPWASALTTSTSASGYLVHAQNPKVPKRYAESVVFLLLVFAALQSPEQRITLNEFIAKWTEYLSAYLCTVSDQALCVKCMQHSKLLTRTNDGSPRRGDLLHLVRRTIKKVPIRDGILVALFVGEDQHGNDISFQVDMS